jgi:hypothetical protein
MGVVWGTAEVVGAARGVTEVNKVDDEGTAQGLAVELSRVVVGVPASVRGVV